MGMIIKGIIIKAISGFYYVSSGREVIECKARGKFRLLGQTPLVGDVCEVECTEPGKGVLSAILPRKNELVRPPVANIDKLCIICSEAPPVTDTFLIDKICVIAEYKNIQPVIVINKCDIEAGENLFKTYSQAGYNVIRTSARTGQGIADLEEALSEGITAFTGNSGVGKSSLLNRVLSGVSLATGDISEKIGRGKHTTRAVELYCAGGGIYVADTPGFSAFDLKMLEDIKKDELCLNFAEFTPFVEHCKFTGCSHTKEEGCAVIQAFQSGQISKSRFDSYLMLYDSLKNIKEWKKKDSV